MHTERRWTRRTYGQPIAMRFAKWEIPSVSVLMYRNLFIKIHEEISFLKGYINIDEIFTLFWLWHILSQSWAFKKQNTGKQQTANSKYSVDKKTDIK